LDAESNIRINLDINEKLGACFIDACITDWQKEFDCLNWTKFMHILKDPGSVWHERRLMSKLYMEQSVKYDWTKRRQEV
jgi:hypothetical protein